MPTRTSARVLHENYCIKIAALKSAAPVNFPSKNTGLPIRAIQLFAHLLCQKLGIIDFIQGFQQSGNMNRYGSAYLIAVIKVCR